MYLTTFAQKHLHKNACLDLRTKKTMTIILQPFQDNMDETEENEQTH